MFHQSLPRPRGPISSSLSGLLRSGHGSLVQIRPGLDVVSDDDAQLALHMIHELSYRGYDAVDDRFETDVNVVALRRQLETAMEAQLRDEIGPLPSDAVATLTGLASATGGPSLSAHMASSPDRRQFREFAVHRSAYQLKEADPHSWGLPRLSGRPKAAMVEIQSDEYGRGVLGEAHAELFADTMRSLGLDPTYGRYIDLLPGCTLATGNLISMFGRQRRLLPAVIGHLALFEMTSTGPMARYSCALDLLGVDERGRKFFDVHVVADAYHEVLALEELVDGYLEQVPTSGPEICFGALALSAVERRFSTRLLEAFTTGRTSLRRPLDTPVAA